MRSKARGPPTLTSCNFLSMDETFDAIILKARRERIHSGRLLHGTMAAAAAGFKTGGLKTREGIGGKRAVLAC